jgi:DNA polymerase-1
LKTPEDEYWEYNLKDCVYTFEIAQEQNRLKKEMKLEAVYAAQQEMFWPVLQAMQTGVAIDRDVRARLIHEVKNEVSRREQFLTDVLGHPLNPRSPKQMAALFYQDLKQPLQMTRAKRGEPSRPTLNDEALQKIALKEPLLRPLINAIADIRTLGIFLSNFLTSPLDSDGRMRCAYNIGGSESGKSAPKTYRLSSSENAFGSGGNLQNIPSSKSKSINKAEARGTIGALGNPYQYPNIRSMFVPDPGQLWWEGDLDRADLQVVAWEANDVQLKMALRANVDIHLLNAFVLNGKEPPPLPEITEGHPAYAAHRREFRSAREFAKTFCHGTNYGGSARTMSAHTGRSVAEVERAQRLWFYAHPGIKQWHDRVKAQATTKRYVENRFGYRWYIFDRVDSVIPEAIAWIPQSTVSIVINKIWKAIYDNLKEVQVLLQVHDSLCGQFPAHRASELLPRIIELAKIPVPYEDPLIIPFTVKTSATSWGDCA